TAHRESRYLAGSGDRAGAPVLRRLVDVDRRGRLGAPSAALWRIVATEAVQYRVLQKPEVRRRHQECAADDRFGREGEAVQVRAGNRLERCLMGDARRRETSLGAQQEAVRRVWYSGCVVQFY